jgi:hypothetical protein
MTAGTLDIRQVGHTIQLAGAIWRSADKTYLVMFPEEDQIGAVEACHLTAEEWQQFLRQSDLLETEVLTQAKDGALAKAIIRKSQRNISQVVSWAVFRRDGFKCRYCGSETKPLTVDHLVLWEEGGPSTEANLASACRDCNKARGNTPYDKWLTEPYYLRVSQGITPAARQLNQDVLAALPSIPKMLHKPSHR